MIKDILTKEALLHHAEELKAKDFKPGFDKMTAEEALLYFELNGDHLCKKLLSGKYEPMPVSAFRIAKSSGKPRLHSRLTAIDTVIQRTILTGIYETVDAKLSPYSFAYRKNRGMTDALTLYKQYASENSYAAKLDTSACFDNLDYTVLRTALKKFIRDQKLIDLIMSFAYAPVLIDGTVMHREKGITQGAPLSPLLCNIYFSSVDELLQDMEASFIRYADDIVIFSKELQPLEAYVEKLSSHLQNDSGLTINKDKFKISSPMELEYLGHSFVSTRYGIAVKDKKKSTPYSAEWHSEIPQDRKRTVDIVSSGILRQKDFSLLFETEESSSDLPIKETDTINIYSNVIFDSGVLKRAFTNGITINVFSQEGKKLGSFIPNAPLKAPALTHEQLMAYYDIEKRIELAISFLLGSFHNTRLVIRYYNKHHPLPEYDTALRKITEIMVQIKKNDDYQKLLLLEARGRKLYYDCFDLFIANSGLRFGERSRRPPKNEVNAMLSFGNTLLYSFIAARIDQTPLDVRIGFLHAANTREESLNLDIAELFKPLIVDRTVFTLINLHEITSADFYTDKGGVYLNERGKRRFIERFNEKLDTTLEIKGEKMSYRRIIEEELRKLTRLFRSNEKYKAFRQVR